MRVALVVNPAARGGAATAAATKTAARLRERGITTTLVAGGSAAESLELLRGAIGLGIDAVAVAGGDGTVHVAIQELAGTGIPLGIVPVGTGNDLATTLGIREMDAAASADVIATGIPRSIDLAHVTRADGTSEYYATVLASGFDSRVNDRANRMRWPRGGTRYNLAILIEFLTLPRLPFEIELELADGSTERFAGDMLMATIGNGRTYGGGIPICPDADVSDGLLDAVLVAPVGRGRLLRLLPRVYRGTHTTVPEVTTRRVRAARLSSPDLTAYADGDPIGVLPLSVEVAPGALSVLAPR